MLIDKLPYMQPLRDRYKAEYDAVEVHPCAYDEDGNLMQYHPTDPCVAMWSVYLHCVEGGIDCFADFKTCDEAMAYAKFLQVWLGEHLKHPDILTY